MRRLLALVVVLLAPGLAVAANYPPAQDQRGERWIITKPPARYLSGTYEGELTFVYRSEPHIRDMCAAGGLGAEPFGCAFVDGDYYCDVYISSDLPEPMRTYVREHEMAHCRGWPADHPEE
jgi:hypothetical protein